MPLIDFAGNLEEIERCTCLYDGFSEAAPFVEEVYSIADQFFKEYPVAPLPAADREESEARIRKGESLALNPKLKNSEVVELLKRLTAALVKANPELKDAALEMVERIDSFAAERSDQISKEEVFELKDLLIKETTLEQDMATFLFSIVLSSFYRQQLALTAEILRTDLYEGGDCPLCGEKPHYGMLRPEDGAKVLDCWLCGTNWVHTRIKCPYCDNTGMDDLGYFTLENKENCRINFCKKCCQYYKIIDARKFGADGDMHLAIHNLASLSHDLMARKEGFAPGSAMEWVNEKEIVDTQD